MDMDEKEGRGEGNRKNRKSEYEGTKTHRGLRQGSWMTSVMSNKRGNR